MEALNLDLQSALLLLELLYLIQQRRHGIPYLLHQLLHPLHPLLRLHHLIYNQGGPTTHSESRSDLDLNGRLLLY